jgi:phosphonoacetaldehyde hydrolase
VAEVGFGRPYRGPLKAIILDWAGTTVDYGSRAPTGVFVELFRRRGVAITMEEARGPMGSHKRDHIAAVLAMPEVAARWEQAQGAPATDADVQAMYEELVPLQLECLPQYADLIPGALEAAADFRRRGLKIGVTTGYNREMVQLLLQEVKARGFEPDCAVSVDDVPAARPAPWMCLRCAMQLQVYPWAAIVKAGDTVPDIHEGLNAGTWTVGLTKTGNEIGLTEREVEALPAEVLQDKLDAASRKLREAGAHYVVEGVGDVPAVLDEIERRLARGESP